jgi:alcohol dehydrogenase (NADP+)
MLKLAAEKGVRTWTNQRPLEEANQAVVDMAQNKARYRYVLVNEKHVKGPSV